MIVRLGVGVVSFVLAMLIVPAQPAPAAPAAAEQELASRYAPDVIVREQDSPCLPGEPFRPVGVEAVLGQPDVVLRGPGGELVAGPTAEDLAGKPAGWYLDLPGQPLQPGCDYERWFQQAGRNLPDSVYARVATDPAHPDTIALQYWFFWVFNDWNDLHEGDWEMVQLLFPAASADQALGVAPTSVAFAQHEGAEVADWDSAKLLRDGDHVAVYPGEGSHAAYFTQSRWFGRSAAAGFGCDNTGIDDGRPARILRPTAPVVSDEPWLRFQGRWGQRELSFNNGPTGPNTKRQWAEPVTWQLEEGRPDAVAIPPTAGAAVDAFCGLAAAGSSLFVKVLDTPVLTLLVLLIGGVLLVWLVRSTRWRGSPKDVVARRSAGQILVGALQLVPRGWRGFAPLAAGVAAATVASLWLQALVLRPPGGSLASVGASPNGIVDHLAIVAIGLAAGAGAFFAVAVAHAVTRDLPAAALVPAVTQRPTRRGWWRLVASYLLITLCAATVLGLPLGAYLASRWAVASPAAVVGDLRFGKAARESARLVRGHRFRALVLTATIAVLATTTGALLGGLIVLVVPGSFWVGNTVALTVFSFGLCWAGAALVLHYFDLLLRQPPADDLRGAPLDRVQP